MEGLDAMYGKGLDPNKYSKKEFQTYSQGLVVPMWRNGLIVPNKLDQQYSKGLIIPN